MKLASATQAPPVPPQAFLELEAAATVGATDAPRTVAAEISLMMLGSWLRFRHIQRSIPLRLTTANLLGI